MQQSNTYESPLGWRDAACSILVQLPGLVLIKSLDSRILAINPALATLLGVRADAAVAGKFEYELAPFLKDSAETFLRQDRETLALRRSRFVDVITYGDGAPHVILAEKSCLVDGTGAAAALFFHGTDLTSRLFGQVGALLERHIGAAPSQRGRAGISYTIASPAPQRKLSAREEECLFFLLRGYTARRIAQKLCLSSRTVEGYIEQLRAQFNAESKVALLERALTEGYGGFLPASLLAPR